MTKLKAPFPYFGGKRAVASQVWERLGQPRQYIEPFCGSAAILLAAPKPAPLEVVGDANGYIANFWRAVKCQPVNVAHFADYPVSHIDLGARHEWLLHKHDEISQYLHDPEWPGDAQVAGWWLWGQCAWIGAGWCEKIPHVSDAGRGFQAVGQIPHVSDAGPSLTSAGAAAKTILQRLSERLDRVRLIHGSWERCLNHLYGGDNTAIFLDPPYLEYEGLYQNKAPVARDVEDWAKENAHLKIALCGHVGDYKLEGWDAVKWSRSSGTYGSTKTKDAECIWYSPACNPAKNDQLDMFEVRG